MSVKSKIAKIVSGGQTGVDRAALDVAIELGIPHGGWCPKGRRAEDGVIADHYLLQETSRRDYSQRTEWNVRDSDATLVLTWGQVEGGTQLAVETAEELRKPFLVLDFSKMNNKLAMTSAKEWLAATKITVLNVAGPRQDNRRQVYHRAKEILRLLLTYSE